MLARAKRAVRLAKHIASERYDLARRWWLERSATAPILVFTMPKTGSSTVWDSLYEMNLSQPIYHAHQLTDRVVAHYERQIADGTYIYNSTRKLTNINHVRERVSTAPPTTRWKVISLVRDPVARAFSSFFQGSWKYFPELDYSRPLPAEQLARLLAMFETKREEQLTWWGDWFDRELKGVFGVDVLEVPFRHERGYQIYPGPRADVMMLRLEDLDVSHRAAFADLLGLPNFRLLNTNVASAKKYREMYAQCAREVVLPPEFLDRMYGQRWVTHFYAPAEIARFRARWTRLTIAA